MLRELAIRFVLWLCAALDINPVEERRRKASPDLVVRGQRWDDFYNEEGGLADMIRQIRTNYFEAASAVGHRDNDKLYEYVVADRLARELEREVQKIVVSGKSEAKRRDMLEREEAARILRAV